MPGVRAQKRDSKQGDMDIKGNTRNPYGDGTVLHLGCIHFKVLVVVLLPLRETGQRVHNYMCSYNYFKIKILVNVKLKN